MSRAMARIKEDLPTETDSGMPEDLRAAEEPQPPVRRARRLTRHRFLSGLSTSMFFVPSLVLIVLFFVLPFVFNIVFAFVDWTSFSDKLSWDGLYNFRLIWDLGVLGQAIKVTIIYAAVVMILQNVVSLTIATLLQRSSRGSSFFRTVFFLPVLISPLAGGYIWSAMLRPNGPINSIISAVIPGSFHYEWLGHPTSALICTAAIEAWKWSGLATLVYIAGLNAVPRSVLEAATMDGASRWTQFWRIKAPLLAPAITFNVVIGFVGTLSAFDIIMATTNGGPGDATTVLNVALYQQYGQGFFGNASALSLVVTVLVVMSAVPLVTWLRRREVTM